jgi:hypothetical protein
MAPCRLSGATVQVCVEVAYAAFATESQRESVKVSGSGPFFASFDAVMRSQAPWSRRRLPGRVESV